jgi:uroporphyrinogen decarboxylase
MASKLSKRDRLTRTVLGRPVDRLPVALWRHFFVEETSRAGLVEAMVRWQQDYDWDFLKINPRACYHVQDWGNRYEYSGSPAVPPSLVRNAVHSADGFRHLDRLDPTGERGRPAPVLAEHLEAVTDIRRALGPEVPLLMTVFTPMSLAAELAGGPEDLRVLIDEDAEAVHAGLRTLTDTFADFATRCLDAGADGLFLATTHVGTTATFALETYEEFGRPYDLEVLDAAADAPFNLLHVCKPRAMIRELAEYPVALLNWDSAHPTNPDLAEVAPLATGPYGQLEGKALVGGLERDLFAEPDGLAALLEQLAAARRAMGERPFVVGSTCTIDPGSVPETVRGIRDAVEAAET